jgi:hypothetical protein
MPQLQEGVALMSSKYFRALTRVVAFMLVLGGLSGSRDRRATADRFPSLSE